MGIHPMVSLKRANAGAKQTGHLALLYTTLGGIIPLKRINIKAHNQNGQRE
jgi:hypothetical protein